MGGSHLQCWDALGVRRGGARRGTVGKGNRAEGGVGCGLTKQDGSRSVGTGDSSHTIPSCTSIVFEHLRTCRPEICEISQADSFCTVDIMMMHSFSLLKFAARHWRYPANIFYWLWMESCLVWRNLIRIKKIQHYVDTTCEGAWPAAAAAAAAAALLWQDDCVDFGDGGKSSPSLESCTDDAAKF